MSSSSTRCLQTVCPHARATGATVEERLELSEEGFDPVTAQTLLDQLLASGTPSVVCSHRPVLPELFDLLGLAEEPLSPAELVVCHHRKGEVVATERHRTA